MTAFLPPNLLALFAARDPIPYLPPASKLGHEKKRLSHGGVAVFIKDFEDPKDTPPPTRVETKDERKERKRKERAEQIAYKLEQDLALWNPNDNPMGTGDPYKTLFVARINYDTSESKLRREFEVYGPVRKISLLNDKMTGKPRGYAFIEYEHERDMHCKSRDTSVTRSKFKVVYWHLKIQDIDPAYKHADGKKIDGRRVLVDVERGRTVKGWRPRRLGGGLGGTRKGGPDENTRFSGRDEYSGSYRDRSGREESPGRDRRRRSRSRERERERRRSRSRERRRSRSREDKDRKRGARRSRSRERDRERKRSRSRDRKRARRSRSRDRRDRDRDDKRGEEGGEGQEYGEDGVVVKEEAEDAYEGYEGGYGGEDQNGYQNEQESYDR